MVRPSLSNLRCQPTGIAVVCTLAIYALFGIATARCEADVFDVNDTIGDVKSFNGSFVSIFRNRKIDLEASFSRFCSSEIQNTSVSNRNEEYLACASFNTFVSLNVFRTDTEQLFLTKRDAVADLARGCHFLPFGSMLVADGLLSEFGIPSRCPSLQIQVGKNRNFFGTELPIVVESEIGSHSYGRITDIHIGDGITIIDGNSSFGGFFIEPQGIDGGISGDLCGLGGRFSGSGSCNRYLRGSFHLAQLSIENPRLNQGGAGSDKDNEDRQPLSKFSSAVLACALLAVSAILTRYGVYKSGDLGGRAALIVMAGFPLLAIALWLLLFGVLGWVS